MNRQKHPLRSDIAWSNRDHIVVHGHDLPNELLGHVNLGDMAFLELTGRLPQSGESIVFNAILVALVEHGITPSALAARMTYIGAPESLQAAVAAGLCGLGSVFVGSMEGAAQMLYETLPAVSQESITQDQLAELAEVTVRNFRERRDIVPGLGHPFHKPVDPRAPRLFQLARENGLDGPYLALMENIASAAEQASGKSLPVNATGAIAAICCEMQFPVRIIRGFGVMARAIGLVGHILEEGEKPMAVEVWRRADDEAGAHLRPSD